MIRRCLGCISTISSHEVEEAINDIAAADDAAVARKQSQQRLKEQDRIDKRLRNCLSLHSKFVLGADQALVLQWRSSCTCTLTRLRRHLEFSKGDYFFVIRNEDERSSIYLKAFAIGVTSKKRVWSIDNDKHSAVKVMKQSDYITSFSTDESFTLFMSMHLKGSVIKGAVFNVSLYKSTTGESGTSLPVLQIVDDHPNNIRSDLIHDDDSFIQFTEESCDDEHSEVFEDVF